MTAPTVSDDPRAATDGQEPVSGVTLGVTLVLTLVAALVWAWAHQYSPYTGRFPAVPVAIGTFAAVQVLVPRARWRADRALAPGNVAVLLFGLQLVALPVLTMLSGPTPGSLPVLPDDRFINQALLMQAAAYAAFAVGLCLLRARPIPNRLLPDAGANSAPVMLAASFVVIGGIGLFLAFPSVGALIDYFSGQGDVFSIPGATSTLGEAAASFLRPFLSIGLVIVWALLIMRRRPGRPMVVSQVAVALLLLAVSATYEYNRAAILIPLLGLLTAYSFTVKRVRMLRLMFVLVLLGTIGFQFGQYRQNYLGTQGGRISATDAGLTGPSDTIADTVQLYGGGAQFWAVVIADTEAAGFHGGATLVGSALLPVPILGKPYRAGSGPVLYNEMLYGRSGITDQNIVFGAELYWNGGLLAVVAGYVLLGVAVRRLDDLVAGAQDPLAAYTWTYCGLWTATLVINSLSVLAQIVVYFMPPIVLIVLVARLYRNRMPEAQP
ncbi:hypothetical protein [Pseudonocardia sp. TRM90224]|uniref:hypothetical protein n=1 Tax=Pseudonocardia sp. TRM90224 TaxID=2812678 RepID=UPI001E630819|nr:hypothetical protein [Pseudonocardia sp. TRM90224]